MASSGRIENAPRVLISNAMLVPHWATWDEFRRLEGLGLTMFGQMTAGSWIYIGTQGILQGTYETFAECANRHFGGTLAGKLLVTAGLGGMGGAQPLAATMNGAACLAIEVDRARIEKRLRTGYVGQMTENLDEALEILQDARERREARSVAVLGNAAELLPELLEKRIKVDVLTDQTSAHDTLNGYVPAHIPYEEALELRKKDPKTYVRRAQASIVEHVQAMLELQKHGAVTFDYGNNIRGEALANGLKTAFDIPGLRAGVHTSALLRRQRAFPLGRALGRSSRTSIVPTVQFSRRFPENRPLCRWIEKAQKQVRFQGLPARICWLGYGERAKMGTIFNDLVARGEVKAPIVIGRDHLDCGSVASPNRETESMKDGSDAIADWPILNALLNATGGASWVSVHHGGGVGMGLSIHAGMVIVADGTREAETRLQRVLTYDPGMGIIRHADAGYERAL